MGVQCLWECGAAQHTHSCRLLFFVLFSASRLFDLVCILFIPIVFFIIISVTIVVTVIVGISVMLLRVISVVTALG